jgi:hypothetical protein
MYWLHGITTMVFPEPVQVAVTPLYVSAAAYEPSRNTHYMTGLMPLSPTNCWKWESASTPEMWIGISEAFCLHSKQVEPTHPPFFEGPYLSQIADRLALVGP